ncbi:MAG TPA: hypothetical protein VHA55_00555 [Pseudorhodoplanes sp.]|nr:hypothetical protein [Pseudorhodoplanes sp.]
MNKLFAFTTAVLVGAAAASPALAKKHHHPAAPAAPQVLLPSPLIGGTPIRLGSTCYVVHSSDWGAGYSETCRK